MDRQVASAPRLAVGTELLGEYQGSGFKEPVFLARRADGQVIRLSRLVYLVAAELDGRKDFERIALRVSERFGRTVSADNVGFLLENKLRPLGMLASTDGSSPKLVRADPVLALHWRAPILPEGMVRALIIVFRPFFFAPVVVAMLAGLAALDFWLFFIHGVSQSAQELLYRPELFLMVLGLILLSTLFHECGHATACHYSGAKPGRIGVGFYLVWLVFYNDVTDAYRLGKAGRLRTDLGGVYFDAVFSLATAGVYLLTGFEPLLLVILLKQLQMLFQFLPFVRLDGYYLVSDLTGVPDLFARIKPILKSMIPGQRTDERVAELKPWARAVVTAWVVTVIPVLLYFFGMLAVNAPAMYAATWDSLLVHYSKVWGAFGDGKVVEGVAGLLRTVLLLVPVVGSTLLFLLVGKRLGMAVWRWSKGKAVLRAALIAAAVTIVGFAFSETVILSPVSSAASAVLGALPEGENLMPRLLGLGILVFILLIIGLGVWNLVGKRLDTAVWRWPEGKVALRAALIAAAVTIVGFAIGFAFWEGTILSLVSSVASAVFGALPQDEYAMRRLLGLAILALTFLVAGLAVRKLLMKRGGFRRW